MSLKETIEDIHMLVSASIELGAKQAREEMMVDTPYTEGFKAGKKYAVEKILAYLGTKTAEQPIAASFASDIVRITKDFDSNDQSN